MTMTKPEGQDRKPSDPPSLAELLDCLTTYPEGTQGHADEKILISTIHGLCLEHGFGRISQLVSAIHAIWLKNEDADKWIEFYRDHQAYWRDR